MKEARPRKTKTAECGLESLKIGGRVYLGGRRGPEKRECSVVLRMRRNEEHHTHA